MKDRNDDSSQVLLSAGLLLLMALVSFCAWQIAMISMDIQRVREAMR